MAAAKVNFRLDQKQDDTTVRAHLEAIEQKTGERAKELDECEIPIELHHVWVWFLELHATRGSNGFGSNPISFTELSAWKELTDHRPRSFEIELIRGIDRVYLGVEAEGANKK